MPLIKSGSKQAVSTNIREMMASGYPQKQAVAASLSNARRYGRKYADGGVAYDQMPASRSIEDRRGERDEEEQRAQADLARSIAAHRLRMRYFGQGDLPTKRSMNFADGGSPQVDYSEGPTAPTFQNWPDPPAELRLAPPGVDDGWRPPPITDDWTELKEYRGHLVDPYKLSPRDLKRVLAPRELRGMDITPPPPTTRMGPRASGGRAYARGGFASGGSGSVMPWTERASARELQHSGFIKSPVPGRTDQLPIGVGGGAYVLPADHVAHVGQGNSMAGGQILDSMFKLGTFGMNRGIKPRMPRLGMRRKQFADGGTPGKTTGIIAAGGEYVVPPEVVTRLGGGDINHGHKILDKWVLDTRKHHIKTLRDLKPPKKS